MRVNGFSVYAKVTALISSSTVTVMSVSITRENPRASASISGKTEAATQDSLSMD